MADVPEPASSVDFVEEKIDFSSDKFNPEAALYAKNVTVPKPDAPIYDNICIFKTKVRLKISEETSVDTTSNASASTFTVDDVNQRFLPHQMPVSKHKKRRDIFTRVESTAGPLATLRRYMDNKLRVKVITRNETGIRGACLGFLQAFDPCWNIVLKDVIEIWTRKKKKKIIPRFENLSLNSVQKSQVTGLMSIVPILKVVDIDKHTEKCTRHVPQMMLRGEHVVMVVLASKDEVKQTETQTEMDECPPPPMIREKGNRVTLESSEVGEIKPVIKAEIEEFDDDKNQSMEESSLTSEVGEIKPIIKAEIEEFDDDKNQSMEESSLSSEVGEIKSVIKAEIEEFDDDDKNQVSSLSSEVGEIKPIIKAEIEEFDDDKNQGMEESSLSSEVGEIKPVIKAEIEEFDDDDKNQGSSLLPEIEDIYADIEENMNERNVSSSPIIKDEENQGPTLLPEIEDSHQDRDRCSVIQDENNQGMENLDENKTCDQDLSMT